MTPYREAPPLPGPIACPRDRRQLVARTAEGETLHVCPGCTGIWLDAATLRRLRADREALDGLALHPLAASARPARGPDTMPGVVCPRCDAHCVRRLHGSGAGALVVDTCREHGMWLDGGELHALLRHERGDRPRPSRPAPRTPASREPVLPGAVEKAVDVALDVLWLFFP